MYVYAEREMAYMYIYIYIYRVIWKRGREGEKEREREREKCKLGYRVDYVMKHLDVYSPRRKKSKPVSATLQSTCTIVATFTSPA